VHKCSRKHGPITICRKCLSPLNNTHILGGCIHTVKLRTKRHNSTFLLLHQLLQNTNGGRWPIIGLDLGNKLVANFSKHNTDIEEMTPSKLQPIPHLDQEGLQDDKPNTTEPKHTILEYILPAHNRPKGHKPDLIRAIGYAFH